MADETRNANVVVSADVSGYTQGTQQAYRDTNKLIESVNKLSTSLDGITKRIGKKILIFSAADVATMTAMVTITARYEKQLATLNAQLSLSGKNLAIYKKGIDEISRSMPATRGELTQLATQIHELGVQSEREAVKMTRTFTQLAAATGESVSGLTQGMIELSRQMGTLNNGAEGISNFSDSLTMVASNAGVSATAVLNFAQSISPFARAAGLGQKELMGISAAFTRAGADGFAAANAFNTILADITRQIQTGSPEISKYSNAVGMSMQKFKELGPAEQLTAIFEAVNEAGPDAIKLLDRMGIDGIRAAKAIQAVSNESGGLKKAIETATAAYGGGATQRGADAAMDNLEDKVSVLRNNLQQMGSAIGEGVMPFAKALLDTFNIMLTKVNDLAQPLLTLAGALGAILAPVTAALGGLTALMGPLSTAMLAMTAIRFSPMRSLFAGIGAGRSGQAAPGFERDANGNFTRAGGVPYWQRGPYGLGQRLGGMMGPPPPPGQMGFFARSTTNLANWAVTNRLGIGAADIMRAQATLYDNASLRQWWNRQSVVGDMSAAGASAIGRGFAATRAAVRHPMDFFRGMRNDPLATVSPGATFAPTAAGRAAEIRNAAVMAGNTTATAANTGAKAGNTVATGANTTVMRSLAGAAGTATRALFQMQLATARFALSMGAQGAAAAGRGVLGMVGGMVGAAGPAAPWIGGALVAGGAGYVMYNKQQELANKNIVNSDTQKNIAVTNAALGLSTDALGDFTDIVKSGQNNMRDFVSVTDAMRYAISNATAALGEYTDANIKNLKSIDQVVGYLQAQGRLDPAQAASLASDVNKLLGPIEGPEAIKKYLDTTSGGTNPYASGMFSRITSGAVASQLGNQGFEGPFHLIGQGFTNEDMSKQVEIAWAAALEDLDLTSRTYDTKVVSQKLGVYLNDAMTAAFDDQESAGIFFQGKTQEQFIKQLEKVFGGEGKYTITAQGVSSGGASFFRSRDEIFANLFDEGNESDLAKNFRDWAKNSGMTAKDFTKSGYSGLVDRMMKGMSEQQYSDWEKGVRETSLGGFARSSGSIKAVTSGDKIGDPRYIVNAIVSLSEEAKKGAGGISGMVSEFQKLKQAVGDVNDPLYQLAQAAQDLATKQMTFSSGFTGGQFGGMQAAWDSANATQANFVNTAAGQAEWTAAEDQKQSIRQQSLNDLKQYNNTVYQYNKQREYSEKDHADSLFQMQKDYQTQTKYAQEDFQLQRIYSMEDFARSMRRAAEDAAKAMWDPFTRTSARGTQSSGMVAFNLDRQLKLIKDQTKNIGILRDRGLDQRTIDNLNLTDPSMAYQVQRWVDEGGSFNAKALNKSGGAARVAAAGGLLNQQEGTRRTREDFERSMERSETAFDKSLKRAASAYEKQLWRFENSYDKSVDRSKAALEDYGHEIMGTTEQVINDTAARLFEALGTNTTDYFGRLRAFLERNGITESSGSTSVPWETGTSNSDNPTSADAAERQGAANQEHKPGPANAWKEGGNWYGMNSKGQVFRLPSDWKDYNTLSPGQQHEAKTQDWVEAAKAAGYSAFAHGGIVTGSTYANIGEAGPEAVIPLNRAGGQFLGKIYGDITMEMVKSLRTAGFGTPGAYSVNGGGHTTINKNTQFMGPITVQAQDPNEMARKLEQKKRLENMRRGANASM